MARQAMADRQTAKKTDFDDYVDDYESLLAEQLRFFDGDDGYFAAYKVELTRAMLPRTPRRILDYGCGIGRSLPGLRACFPESEIHGFDVSQASLAIARERYPFATFFDALSMPADFEADLIFAAGVFHHIAPAERVDAVEFCRSHLSPAGDLVVFEHNPYNPVTRRMVSQCPFDEDAVLLPPSELVGLATRNDLRLVERAYTLFFPRRLGWLRPVERHLKGLPLGGQYYVWATRRDDRAR